MPDAALSEPAAAPAPAPPSAAPGQVPPRTVLLCVVLALGAGLRLAQYLFDRALWLDEAMLAVSLDRPLGRLLLEPLEYGQSAPAGFLVLERLAVALFGGGERSLRLVPFIAGLVALGAFWPVARRCLRPNGALLATFLFALAPLPIYFGAEVKAYALDLAAALLVTLAALRVREDDARAERWAVLAAAGAAAVWLSYPVVFVMAAAGIALAVRAARRRPVPLARLAAVAAAWGASFAASHLLTRRTAGTAFFQEYWGSGFISPPTSAAGARALGHALMRPFHDPLELAVPAAGVAACLVGLGWMLARRRFVAALVAGPVALTLLAAVLRVYPFGADIFAGGRVLLFLLPAFLLMIAAGVEAVPVPRGRGPVVLAAFAALVLIGRLQPVAYVHAFLAVPALQPWIRVPAPFPRDRFPSEIRPVVAYLGARVRPGDAVYVYVDAVPAFRYYAGRTGFRHPFAAGTARAHEPAKVAAELGALEGSRRVWIVFSHTPGAAYDPFMRYLVQRRTIVDGIPGDGAMAILYDLPPSR